MAEQRAITERCHDCEGGVMEGRIESYRYVESGLRNVVLENLLVFHCTKCSAIAPEITSAGPLHTLIGVRLLFKESRLSGDEVRFLRKLVGYSATELAALAGTSKAVVSRWENRSTLGESSDRLVRLICLNKLIMENKSREERSLIDGACLPEKMENALRTLRRKETSKKTVYIDMATRPMSPRARRLSC